MRHYESIWIINPNLTDEDCGAVIKKFSDLIEKQKGVIVKVDEWGKQSLAYGIKKFDKGFYVLLEYCGGPETTAVLERDLKLDDRIFKYQTVKLADKVDPQDLILKQKEDEKGESAEGVPALEKAQAFQNKEKAPIEEVKNGV